MDGSPSSVLSLGYGSWGSVGLVVTLGFGISTVSDPVAQNPFLPVMRDSNWKKVMGDDNWAPVMRDSNWRAKQ